MKPFIRLSFFELNECPKGHYLTESFDYFIDITKIITIDSCEIDDQYAFKDKSFNLGGKNECSKFSKEYPIIYFEKKYFKAFMDVIGYYPSGFLKDDINLPHDPTAPRLVATCSFYELEECLSIGTLSSQDD